VASLWRELWDAHEAWGGYLGTRDPRAYEDLARRLDDDARVRAGQPVLGRHVHLIADIGGRPVGQVEGWLEKHGVLDTTPYTCEVRSLIVTEHARTSGAGRALLDGLARYAAFMSRGLPCVLAAEVLEQNPAQAFYVKLGYVAVAWSARIPVQDACALAAEEGVFARAATPKDALAVAALDVSLAARRRAQRDQRFDRPRAVEATMVGAIAAHLGRPPGLHDPVELVAVDPQGVVRATASLVVSSLDPPFLPSRRALLGRFAVDPATDPAPFLREIVRTAGRVALLRGAHLMELSDLDPPGSALHSAALSTGAHPWSRVVEKMA
jgi:GNAT superfamily N-acetyltransferase